MPLEGDLARDGWQVLPFDQRVRDWAGAAHRAAMIVTADPALQARWLRHGGTWFVGVDALPNAADGSIGGVAFAGPWADLADLAAPLHRAQLSVVHPGYPGRDPDDTDAAHRFRLTRDAAHLDGLLALGPARRRHLREPHRIVLGLPLTEHEPGCSPLVIWQGSARIIRSGFAAAFAGVAPVDWPERDVTEVYQTLRREVFARCPRVEVHARPGQALLMHRLAIHGVAPWTQGAKAPPEGRMFAWFRPLVRKFGDWLELP